MKSMDVSFTLEKSSFQFYDEDGLPAVFAGDYIIEVIVALKET